MKFRTKILVCMVWVLALAIGISGTAMIQSSFSSALDREKLSAQHNYKMLTSALGVVAVNSAVTDLDQVYNTLDQFYASMDLASIKLEQDGKLLYSQGEYFFGNGDPEDGQCILWVHDVKSDTYLSICGWITIGESRMRLTLASSVGEIFEERDQTRQTFCWIYFAAVALGGPVELDPGSRLDPPPGSGIRRHSKNGPGGPERSSDPQGDRRGGRTWAGFQPHGPDTGRKYPGHGGHHGRPGAVHGLLCP